MRSASSDYRTYLVEQYAPGLAQAQLKDWAGTIRRAADRLAEAGRNIRVESSTIVPEDECLLTVLGADSELLVREVFSCTGLHIDRVSLVVSVPGSDPRPPSAANPTEPSSPPHSGGAEIPTHLIGRTRARKETS